MKIRTDFVSNSSSSSFVIVGKIFDYDVVYDVLKKNPNVIAEKFDLSRDDDFEDFVYDYGIEEIIGAFGLDAQEEGDGDHERVLIGLDPTQMTDDQTLKSFKEEITNKLNDVGLDAKVDDVKFVSGGSGPDCYTFFESLG